MDKIESLKKKYYPNDAKNGTLSFYDWLRRCAPPNAVVLNIGAGCTAKSQAGSLRGRVKRVVGIDLGAEVATNSDLDCALIADGMKIPFKTSAFDLVWADYVLEHIERPLPFLREVARVLKPGASFFFRTPNKYHYVSWVSRWTPFRFHQWISPYLQGVRPEEDERHPTFYRLNTKREILRVTSPAGFRCAEIRLIEPEPAYLAFHPSAFLVGVAYERAVNRCSILGSLRANILGRLEK